MLRFHTQTAGVQLSAQQPEVNLIRVTVQALAAVLGGTQSLHTNSFDEALGLPTTEAARLAVRTQQVLQNETDLIKTVDPLAGSYAIEKMTDDIESAAEVLIKRIDELGGAIAGVQAGFQKGEIEQSAYTFSREVEDGSRVIVGVNAFTDTDSAPEPFEPLRVDPAIEAEQVARLAQLKAERDDKAVSHALSELSKAAATPDTNVVPFLREALANKATVGEVCDVLKNQWGTYQPSEKF